MEKRCGFDWACIVEPVSKFVQCFGVSKRPDQYARLICGSDRIRMWRLADAATYEQEVKAILDSALQREK